MLTVAVDAEDLSRLDLDPLAISVTNALAHREVDREDSKGRQYKVKGEHWGWGRGKEF